MEVKATAKYIRVQPRKVRIIADEVRGTNALHTASLLRYHTSKSAKALHKVLVSAMANAQENHNLSPEGLRISAILVDEGPRLKRMQARAMGRGNRIIKKTSHITVVVEDYEVARPVRPHGTKAKTRPTFGQGKGKKSSPTAAPVAAVPEVEEPIVEEVIAEEPAAEAPAVEATETEVSAPVAETAEESTPIAEAEVTATDEPASEEVPATTEEADASDDKGAE